MMKDLMRVKRDFIVGAPVFKHKIYKMSRNCDFLKNFYFDDAAFILPEDTEHFECYNLWIDVHLYIILDLAIFFFFLAVDFVYEISSSVNVHDQNKDFFFLYI